MYNTISSNTHNKQSVCTEKQGLNRESVDCYSSKIRKQNHVNKLLLLGPPQYIKLLSNCNSMAVDSSVFCNYYP